MTRLGDLLDFGQLFKAFGTACTYFPNTKTQKIIMVLSQSLALLVNDHADLGTKYQSCCSFLVNVHFGISSRLRTIDL